MADIIYFVPGDNRRYINRNWKRKITIGDKISKEGYYIGNAVEKEKCIIFYGKPYIPSINDIPSYVNFDPNKYRVHIVQDSIRYYLVKHKKSNAHFAICCYFLDNPGYYGLYFSDLLTFMDGEWKTITEWPFKAYRWYANDKLSEYWKKYRNYYEEDFEIIHELKGSCVPQGA